MPFEHHFVGWGVGRVQRAMHLAQVALVLPA